MVFKVLLIFLSFNLSSKFIQTNELNVLIKILQSANSETAVFFEIEDCLTESCDEYLQKHNRKNLIRYFNIVSEFQDKNIKKEFLLFLKKSSFKSIIKNLHFEIQKLKNKEVSFLGIAYKNFMNLENINLILEFLNFNFKVDKNNYISSGILYFSKEAALNKLIFKINKKNIIVISSNKKILEMFETVCKDLNLNFIGIEYHNNEKIIEKEKMKKIVQDKFEKFYSLRKENARSK